VLHFGSEYPAGSAADLADPDGDARPNLLEYAFGDDPHSGDAGELSVQAAPYAGYPGYFSTTMRFWCDAWNDDITYTVEYSYDLQTWRTLGTSVGGAHFSGDARIEDPYYYADLHAPRRRVSATVVVNQPRVFLRVRIEPIP
jgi:hypothetical protein